MISKTDHEELEYGIRDLQLRVEVLHKLQLGDNSLERALKEEAEL